MDEPRDHHTKQSKLERERQIPYDITYMWDLKCNTNKCIHETESDPQIQVRGVWLPRGGGEKDWGLGLVDANYSIIYRMDKQQGPTV